MSTESTSAVASVQIKTAEAAAAAAADQARLERTLAEAAAARGAAERRAESAEVAPNAFLEYLYPWVLLRVPGVLSGDSRCG
jgi:hypothetical protein